MDHAKKQLKVVVDASMFEPDGLPNLVADVLLRGNMRTIRDRLNHSQVYTGASEAPESRYANDEWKVMWHLVRVDTTAELKQHLKVPLVEAIRNLEELGIKLCEELFAQRCVNMADDSRGLKPGAESYTIYMVAR